MSGHYLKIEVTKYMCHLLRIFKLARSPPNPAIFTFKNIMQMTTYAFRFEFIGLPKYYENELYFTAIGENKMVLGRSKYRNYS